MTVVDVQDVCRAVRQGLMMRLTYGGRERLVAPYIHGRTSAGSEVLLCVQVEGGSASQDPSPWRLLHLDLVTALDVLDGVFAPSADALPVSREVPEVHCMRHSQANE